MAWPMSDDDSDTPALGVLPPGTHPAGSRAAAHCIGTSMAQPIVERLAETVTA